MLPDFDIPSDPDEGPYHNAGAFGLKLCEGIAKKTLSEEKISRAFYALNEIAKIDDLEIQNQLSVGVLEMLLDHPASIRAVRERMSGEPLYWFEKAKSFYGIPEPEELEMQEKGTESHG